MIYLSRFSVLIFFFFQKETLKKASYKEDELFQLSSIQSFASLGLGHHWANTPGGAGGLEGNLEAAQPCGNLRKKVGCSLKAFC